MIWTSVTYHGNGTQSVLFQRLFGEHFFTSLHKTIRLQYILCNIILSFFFFFALLILILWHCNRRLLPQSTIANNPLWLIFLTLISLHFMHRKGGAYSFKEMYLIKKRLFYFAIFLSVRCWKKKNWHCALLSDSRSWSHNSSWGLRANRSSVSFHHLPSALSLWSPSIPPHPCAFFRSVRVVFTPWYDCRGGH